MTLVLLEISISGNFTVSVASSFTMMLYSCVFLKLVSYVMVNRWYRLESTGVISSDHFHHPELKRTQYNPDTHTGQDSVEDYTR